MMKVLLLGITLLLLMSTVGAYASTTGAIGDETVASPNAGPLSIGWTVKDGNVDGVRVTWTPKAAGTYTIQATTAGVTWTITSQVITAVERTDVVPIPAVDPFYIETVNVAIVEI